jgi:hypothetical protein
MMFVILISIGQVLTPYGDVFLICRQDMSRQNQLEIVKHWLCLEGGEAFEHMQTVIIDLNKLPIHSTFSLFLLSSSNLKNLKNPSWQQSQDISHIRLVACACCRLTPNWESDSTATQKYNILLLLIIIIGDRRSFDGRLTSSKHQTNCGGRREGSGRKKHLEIG